MTKLDKTLFEQYAELKVVAKLTEKKLKDLAPKIREQMESNSLEEVNGDLGTFSFTSVPVWTYPKEIIVLEEELEKKKEVAKQTGTATHEDRKDLKFYPKKDEHSSNK